MGPGGLSKKFDFQHRLRHFGMNCAWKRNVTLDRDNLLNAQICSHPRATGMQAHHRLLQNLLRSEDGFILSTEFLLCGSVAVLGLLVGLVTIRDSLILEMEDMAATFGYLNQSYEYAGVDDTDSTTQGGLFEDTLETGDPQSGAFIQFTAIGAGASAEP